MFPPIFEEDFSKLVADIKENGLHQPVILYQGKILDGNNRYRACDQARIEPRFADFKGTDAQAQAYVVSANIHRRHLSPDQRREIIATLLKVDPTKSDRQIAATAKVDNKTVAAVRGRMEATEEIPQLDKTTGADGKTRKRKASKPKSGSGGPKGKKEMITFKEVVNASTALNAYGVLEEHLLDALRDVNDHSDFSQANDCGRRTIEKLEEFLGQMEPEVEEAA
jgi:hypothetical protein